MRAGVGPSGSARLWRGARRACLLAVGMLYALSIPWYRAAGEAPRVWLGLPDWVAVALVCYAAAACLNALAWVLSDVADAPRASGAAPRREPPAGGEDAR
jgi:hypothetical protein